MLLRLYENGAHGKVAGWLLSASVAADLVVDMAMIPYPEINSASFAFEYHALFPE
jgi:hypothetical protein